MDDKLKVFKDGTGNFYALNNFGIKKTVDPVDLPSLRVASSLGPGEFINVSTNKYSTIKMNTLTSVDMTSCSYKFKF